MSVSQGHSARVQALASAARGPLVVVDHGAVGPYLCSDEAGHDFILGKPTQRTSDMKSAWATIDIGLQEQLVDRDPRRTEPLVKWILSLPLEFHGDSAFASTLSFLWSTRYFDQACPK